MKFQERKKDLLDHRDDSTFSFDPSNLNVKKLNKHYKKKIDSRKGVLLASYSRKKTKRRKKGKESITNNQVFMHWLDVTFEAITCCLPIVFLE